VGLCELSYSATQQQLVNSNALVYCDLISPQLIGTTKVRCLRSFRSVPSDYDSEFLYENVYYVSVEERAFLDISIAIQNLCGERITFKDNKTPLKAVLHFRQVITHSYINMTSIPHPHDQV